jgi:hypothetical protein
VREDYEDMAGPVKSRDVSAKSAVDAIRSSRSNKELMEYFKISSKGFADLLKQLLQKNLITEEDLKNRGIKYTVTKKAEPSKPAPIAPAPREDDEDFLDTVTLTEMLSFKDPTSTAAGAAAEIDGPDEEAEADMDGKKVKFTLSGLFKK